jgi:hypothetical protein
LRVPVHAKKNFGGLQKYVDEISTHLKTRGIVGNQAAILRSVRQNGGTLAVEHAQNVEPETRYVRLIQPRFGRKCP